jgi:hypothetical protein
MTWEELEKVEAFLKENGYRKGGKPYHCNADYYWYKPFGKDCNHYDEGRSLYQVLMNVYDWRKFWDRDPSLREFNKAASITASIHISRTIDEVGIELNWDLTKDGFDLKDIEDKAYCFWRYVEDNFGAPPKE